MPRRLTGDRVASNSKYRIDKYIGSELYLGDICIRLSFASPRDYATISKTWAGQAWLKCGRNMDVPALSECTPGEPGRRNCRWLAAATRVQGAEHSIH